jgi:hypothetical protein
MKKISMLTVDREHAVETMPRPAGATCQRVRRRGTRRSADDEEDRRRHGVG